MFKSLLLACLLFSLICQASSAEEKCRRIISLSPALTESVFALGLNDGLVGVTRYCRYPAEARRLPKVGGLMDLNTEALLSLHADTVLAPKEFDERLNGLARFPLRIEFFDQHSVGEILSGIKKLGELCGRAEEASRLSLRLDARIKAVSAKVKDKRPVRALIVIRDAEPEGNTLKGLFISGRDGFYDELLRLSGGLNAYNGLTSSMPNLSIEGLLALDPEVVIEIAPYCPEKSCGGAVIDEGAPWKSWPQLTAVRKRQIFLLGGDYAVIPGPRFVELLEEFSGIIEKVRTN